MNRMQLLAMIAALLAVLAAVVICASPYAPVVQPVADIEEIWAIEDARVESDVPLVTAMENHGMRLGYDAQENTFYCPIGLETGDEWPQLHLTAPGAKDINLVFVDDYSYDWCSDAIRDGYPYQVLAYSDEEYWYFDMVFTGLPIVTLTVGTEIPAHVDVPADVTISWPGEEAFSSTGRTHKRGAISLWVSQKHGLKVEFTRGGVDGNKVYVNAPFLNETDEMTLLACSIDPLMIRDKLSWDMYNSYMNPDEPFGCVETEYVELFIDEEYQGVYLLLDKYVYEQEMSLKSPDAALTDSFFRVAACTVEDLDRPGIADSKGRSYEQHYAPEGDTMLHGIKPYLEMIELENDAAFSRCVLQRADLDSVIRYALFVQACALTDNESNNMGIWAHREKENMVYHYVPWDLDMSWGIGDNEVEYWQDFELFDRMIRLDSGGVTRKYTQEIWQEMREKAFNQEKLYGLLANYEQILNESGAYYRDSCRWGTHQETLDTYNVYSYALDRFEMMDSRIGELTEERFENRQIMMGNYETQDIDALDDALRGLEEYEK